MNTAKRPRPSARKLLGFAALVLLALALRAWALGWGVPHAGRYYPYHPDEAVLLHAACMVNPLWGDLTPEFYNYGSLDILLPRLAYDLVSVVLGWGSVPQLERPMSAWVADFGRLLLVGRWVTVLLGVGCVLATYALGRRLFSERAGWIAALFLAVAPLPVLLGHYFTVDIPAAFFTTVSLALAACAVRAEDARRTAGWCIAAGAVAGLATGTKYNSITALAALAVPLWFLGREKAGWRYAAGAGVLTLLAAAAAFVLATPGALFQPELFVDNVRYEMMRNEDGQGILYRHTPPAYLYHLGISLPVGLEWPLYLLCLAGVGWSLWNRRREDALLLLFLALTFLSLAPAERKFLRYVTPLVPALVVLAARVVDENLRGRGKWAWGAAAGLAGAAALASTVAHLGVLSAPDVRDEVAAYLREHARPDDIVALGADAWYYTPPLHPSAGSVKVLGVRSRQQQALGQPGLYGGPPVWDQVPAGAARPDVIQLDGFRVLAPSSTPPAGALPVRKLAEHQPRFVLLNDYEYEDPERIRRSEPGHRNGILDLKAALEDYRLREFRPRPSLFGFTWWSRSIPPHDWRYFMPTVQVYERRGTAAEPRPSR